MYLPFFVFLLTFKNHDQKHNQSRDHVFNTSLTGKMVLEKWSSWPRSRRQLQVGNETEAGGSKTFGAIAQPHPMRPPSSWPPCGSVWLIHMQKSRPKSQSKRTTCSTPLFPRKSTRYRLICDVFAIILEILIFSYEIMFLIGFIDYALFFKSLSFHFSKTNLTDFVSFMFIVFSTEIPFSATRLFLDSWVQFLIIALFFKYVSLFVHSCSSFVYFTLLVTSSHLCFIIRWFPSVLMSLRCFSISFHLFPCVSPFQIFSFVLDIIAFDFHLFWTHFLCYLRSCLSFPFMPFQLCSDATTHLPADNEKKRCVVRVVDRNRPLWPPVVFGLRSRLSLFWSCHQFYFSYASCVFVSSSICTLSSFLHFSSCSIFVRCISCGVCCSGKRAALITDVWAKHIRRSVSWWSEWWTTGWPTVLNIVSTY